jgi:ribosome-binding factor A
MGDAMRAELARLVRERLKDPRLAPAGLLTVTQVRLTRDLSVARVLVSFVGGDETKVPAALVALESAAGLLRGELGRALDLRRTPELRFIHDTSSADLQHIEQLLKEDT